MRWTWAVAVLLASLGVASGARSDDSCSMAQNGICEEVHLGRGFCMPATDTSDCAEAYVLPQSAERQLNAFDVHYLAPEALRLARNEIFARHGYRFDSNDLQAFFGSRSWYRATGRDVSLSPVEQANVSFLRGIEGGSDPWVQHRRAPDGSALPPWTAWTAEVVHADGRTEEGAVDGLRGRVSDPATGRTVVVRVDREDALHYGGEGEYGVALWWSLFPPVLLEPFVQGLRIVPQPIGRETWGGEPVTRVRLDWSEGGGIQTLHGEALLTDDGIFVQVAVEGVFAECCGGEEDLPWRLEYRLENLQRQRPDLSLFEPPASYHWGYAG